VEADRGGEGWSYSADLYAVADHGKSVRDGADGSHVHLQIVTESYINITHLGVL
jgi:hypothetical protein